MMKKTLTINISGLIFNIDEDAYEMLNAYLDRIHRYFSGQEGGDEVCSDIEARIAELLTQRVSGSKQSVTTEDVMEVIATMGDTEDLSGDTEAGKKGDLGLRETKRLFRDPERRVLGGVCGGLGAYFNLDPVLFRILFIILVCFSGLGILLYLLLWIITPLASSASDRLRMSGKPVTIRNIEQSLRSEWTQVKGTLNGLATEAKGTYKRNAPAFGIMMENIGKACLAVLRVFWHIFRVIFGIVLILIGLSLIFALLCAIFGWLGPVYNNGHDVIFSVPAIIQAFIGKGVSPGLVMLTLIIFLGIPFLMMLYGGLRMAFRIPKIQYSGATAFAVWVVSLLMLGYLSYRISMNYRMSQSLSQKNPDIGNCLSDTLYIALDTHIADSLEKHEVVTAFHDPGLWIMENRAIILRPVLSVTPSDDTLVHLVQNVCSRGRTPADALKNTKEVRYRYTINDSLITFGQVVILPAGSSWSGRDVRVDLSVPPGRVVVFDSAVCRILNRNIHFDPYWMCGKAFTMTEEGLQESATMN